MSEHDGHRHRIIEKLDTGVLCEHELLEILLFNALPAAIPTIWRIGF